MASSPTTCPEMPPGKKWTSTTTGSFVPGTKDWGTDVHGTPVFKEYADNASTTATASIETYIDLPVIAGATYTLAFNTAWGYGNFTQAQSSGSTLTVSWGTDSFTGYTRSGSMGNNSPDIVNAPQYTARTLTTTATSTGTLRLKATIVVNPRPNFAGSANDDIFVTLPTFDSCTQH